MTGNELLHYRRIFILHKLLTAKNPMDYFREDEFKKKIQRDLRLGYYRNTLLGVFEEFFLFVMETFGVSKEDLKEGIKNLINDYSSDQL